jgi:hypothetical protein
MQELGKRKVKGDVCVTAREYLRVSKDRHGEGKYIEHMFEWLPRGPHIRQRCPHHAQSATFKQGEVRRLAGARQLRQRQAVALHGLR